MAHEIESFFWIRQDGPPWHGLGNVLECPPPTASDAMVAAGCDWKVRLEPLSLPDGRLAPRFASVRESDNRILGTVGPDYAPLQNRFAFGWFDSFLRDGTASIRTAGSLREGSRIFVQAFLAGAEADVVTGDPVRAYLLLSHGHDGSLAVDIRFTPTRVVCQNTLSAALGDNDAPRVVLKHTKGIELAMSRAKEVVDLARRTFARSVEQYRFLASRNVKSDTEIKRFVRLSFGKVPDPETGIVESYRYESDVIGLIHGGEGQKLPGVSGTWWAAYNGVTEYVSHMRGRDESRQGQVWFGMGREINRRALDLAVSMAA